MKKFLFKNKLYIIVLLILASISYFLGTKSIYLFDYRFQKNNLNENIQLNNILNYPVYNNINVKNYINSQYLILLYLKTMDCGTCIDNSIRRLTFLRDKYENNLNYIIVINIDGLNKNIINSKLTPLKKLSKNLIPILIEKNNNIISKIKSKEILLIDLFEEEPIFRQKLYGQDTNTWRFLEKKVSFIIKHKK